MKLFALVAIASGQKESQNDRKVNCPVPQWLNDTDVKCSNAHHGGSYCSTSCPPGYESFVTECNCGRYCKWTSGKPYCFDPTEYDYYGENIVMPGDETTTSSAASTTTMQVVNVVTTTEAPITEESSGDYLAGLPPRRSEKIRKKKEEKEKDQKEPQNECKRFEWFGLSSVTCSNGVKNGSSCQMVEGACKNRYITTVLTCKCDTKKGANKCKWTVGPKDRPLNSKGPKCIRGSKKGVKEDTCKEEMWFKSSFVKCTSGLKRGSTCKLNNCDDNEESNRTQCMCFERSKGVRKCRWNKKPKCKKTDSKKSDKDKKDKAREEGENDLENAPTQDAFRRMPVSSGPTCPEEYWDYAEGIKCTDGYNNGSMCAIQGKQLVSSKSICSCHGDYCSWVHEEQTSQPTCRSRLMYLNISEPSSQSLMQMDFVAESVEEETEEAEEGESEVDNRLNVVETIDYSASNPDLCMKLPDDGITLCSDRNRDGSYCRRLDCKSNETACLCDENGQCSWSAGAPVCLEDADLANGCQHGSCDGCDMDDWMFEAQTECTNFNHESSECYRSNCYYPLASTRAKCVCAENRRGDKFCYWDSIPLCFSPALF